MVLQTHVKLNIFWAQIGKVDQKWAKTRIFELIENFGH